MNFSILKNSLIGLIIASLLSGCAFNQDSQKNANGGVIAGYTLGSPPRPDTIKKIAIPRINSDIQSDEPHLQMEITNLIIDEFTKELTYDVVPNSSEAEAVLEVSLIKFHSSAVTYSDRDAKDNESKWESKSSPSEFRIQLVASVKMVEVGSSNVVWQANKVRGKYDYTMNEDFQLLRREAILQAGRDLAQQILQTAVERW